MSARRKNQSRGRRESGGGDPARRSSTGALKKSEERTWVHRATRYLHWLTIETWRDADARALAARTARAEAGLGADWRPMVTLVMGALILIALNYAGKGEGFDVFAAAFLEAPWVQDPFSATYQSYEKIWWTSWRIGLYFVVPALYIKLVMGEKLRDHGLRIDGFRSHLGIYAVCLLVVLPLVYYVSSEPAFQNKYPMYRMAGESLSELLWWELLYAGQFFALEFFFRGHWLQSLERTMGSHAIFAMMVPYCMIHFGKPWPESVGAIVAGIALGTLALRYRSIWAGFLVHVTVAVAMDVASLLQRGAFPTDW